MSSGVVYLYFASKDDVIAALAAQNLAGIAEAARALAREHGRQGAGVVLAELLGYIRGEHERDALAALALLTWSESLRNDVLAERLNAAFTEIHGLFTTLLRRPGQPSQPGAPGSHRSPGLRARRQRHQCSCPSSSVTSCGWRPCRPAPPT